MVSYQLSVGLTTVPHFSRVRDSFPLAVYFRVEPQLETAGDWELTTGNWLQLPVSSETNFSYAAASSSFSNSAASASSTLMIHVSCGASLILSGEVFRSSLIALTVPVTG